MKITKKATLSEYYFGQHFTNGQPIPSYRGHASVIESMTLFLSMLERIGEAGFRTGTKLKITIETIEE